MGGGKTPSVEPLLVEAFGGLVPPTDFEDRAMLDEPALSAVKIHCKRRDVSLPIGAAAPAPAPTPALAPTGATGGDELMTAAEAWAALTPGQSLQQAVEKLFGQSDAVFAAIRHGVIDLPLGAAVCSDAEVRQLSAAWLQHAESLRQVPFPSSEETAAGRSGGAQHVRKNLLPQVVVRRRCFLDLPRCLQSR